MKITKFIAAVAATALATFTTATAQVTNPAGITLGELGTAIQAAGGRVLGQQEGLLIVESRFGQQFIAGLEFCDNAPRCSVVYMGTRISNRSGQTLASINRLNSGPGLGRFIWLDNQRSDLDSRFLVDGGITLNNLVLNIALYTVEVDAFFRLMTSGVSASLDGRDPRSVFDGDLTLEQVGVRDEAMAAFLNQLPAAAADGLIKHDAAVVDHEKKADQIDSLLDELEHSQKWGSQ